MKVTVLEELQQVRSSRWSGGVYGKHVENTMLERGEILWPM